MLIKDMTMKSESPFLLGKSERQMSLLFPPFKTAIEIPKLVL